jgi:hypothetical protein
MSYSNSPWKTSARPITVPAAPASSDINVAAYNTFVLPKLTDDVTIPAPLYRASYHSISFVLTAGASTYAVSWETGSGGYLFATAGSALGVTQAQLDNAIADAAEDDVFRVLWEWNDSLDRWICLALSGPFT